MYEMTAADAFQTFQISTCMVHYHHHTTPDPPTDADAGEDDAVLRHSGEGMRGRRNVNLAYGMASPVDAFPPAERSGVHDAFGNAWEWQEDHFSPLPGTESRSLAVFVGVRGRVFVVTQERAGLDCHPGNDRRQPTPDTYIHRLEHLTP